MFSISKLNQNISLLQKNERGSDRTITSYEKYRRYIDVMANISQNFEDNEYDIVIKYDENIMHKKFDAILMHNDIDDEDEDIYIIKKQPSIFDSCFLKFCVRRLDI